MEEEVVAGVHAHPCQGQNRKQQCHSGQFKRDHYTGRGWGTPGEVLRPEGLRRGGSHCNLKGRAASKA